MSVSRSRVKTPNFEASNPLAKGSQTEGRRYLRSGRSLQVKNQSSFKFTEKQSKKKVTPTRENSGANCGDWVEENVKNKVNQLLPSPPEKKVDGAFQILEHKELTGCTRDVEQSSEQTPERRLTFELENSINDIEVLRRDSEQFSDFKKKDAIRTAKVIKKKKKPSETRNLRKKVEVLFTASNDASPPANLHATFGTVADRKIKEDDSVIVISSTENSPVSKPVLRSKVDLLKHTLTKRYNAVVVESKDSVSKSSCRKKVPNFAALHKKQFDQMEDIASMKKRKEERAKLLLSGSKPPPQKIAIDSPLSKKLLFSKQNEKADTPRKVHFHPQVSDSPKLLFTLPKTPKPQVRSHKERRKTKEGFTRYGFKKILPVEKENKVAQLAAVTNKVDTAVNGIKEKGRQMLKGVRINRRFELLMKMRNGKA